MTDRPHETPRARHALPRWTLEFPVKLRRRRREWKKSKKDHAAGGQASASPAPSGAPTPAPRGVPAADTRPGPLLTIPIPGDNSEATVFRFRLYSVMTNAARRTVVETDVATVPRGQVADLYRLRGRDDQDLDVSDPLCDAIGAYVTAKLDGGASRATERWQICSYPSPVEGAAALDRCTQWLTALAERPLKNAATSLGASQAEAAVEAGITADLVVEPFEGPIQRADMIADIAGIAFGLVTGLHPIVAGCFHDLAARTARKVVAREVADSLRREIPAPGRRLARAPAATDDRSRNPPSRAARTGSRSDAEFTLRPGPGTPASPQTPPRDRRRQGRDGRGDGFGSRGSR
jgi:hypothetical protein